MNKIRQDDAVFAQSFVQKLWGWKQQAILLYALSECKLFDVARYT